MGDAYVRPDGLHTGDVYVFGRMVGWATRALVRYLAPRASGWLRILAHDTICGASVAGYNTVIYVVTALRLSRRQVLGANATMFGVADRLFLGGAGGRSSRSRSRSIRVYFDRDDSGGKAARRVSGP